MKTLALDAAKVGNITINELLALAEVQGCELRIKFEKKPEQLEKEEAAAKAAAAVGPALREEIG